MKYTEFLEKYNLRNGDIFVTSKYPTRLVMVGVERKGEMKDEVSLIWLGNGFINPLSIEQIMVGEIIKVTKRIFQDDRNISFLILT